MRWGRLLLLALSTAALEPGALLAQQRLVSGKELVRRGFFSDFAELDLESLLKPDDLTIDLASRTDLSLEEAPGVVAILTAKEIHELGARTLTDVLRTVPGFDILVDNLGHESVTVRGAPRGRENGSSENILILYNGHPLNGAIDGGATALSLEIPVGGLKKIEILRGAGSAVFGGGALLAVVNLVSDTTRDFTGTAASIGFGSFGAQDYELRLGNVLGDLNLTGFVHFDRASGPGLSVPADTQTLRDPAQIAAGLGKASLAPGTSSEGIRSVEASYHVTFRNFEMNARFKGESADGYVGLADALGTENNLSNRQYSFDLGYTRLLGPYITQTRFEYTRSSNENHLDVFPPGFVHFSGVGSGVQFPSGVLLVTSLNTQRVGLEGVAQRVVGEHHLEGGVSLAHESTFGLGADANLDFRTFVPSNSIAPLAGAVPDMGRTLSGLWAEDSWKATARLTLTGGGRWDHLNDVGGVVSPRLAAVYALPEGPTFKLLYGRSYRAPSFEELAFHLPGLDGNKDLKPVTADTLEGAVVWRRQDLLVSADYFFTALHNLITTDGPYSTTTFQPFVNAAPIHVKGLEIQARRVLPFGTAAFLSYTHESATYEDTGTPAPDVSPNLFSLGATFPVGDWLLATPMLLLRDSRARVAGDARPPVAGYGLVDLNLRTKKLYRTLQLTLTAHNLLDKAYADPSPLGGVPGDYPRPGRSFLVLASYKF
jgi:outer membrane receptor protein involved in Fe transport